MQEQPELPVAFTGLQLVPFASFSMYVWCQMPLAFVLPPWILGLISGTTADDNGLCYLLRPWFSFWFQWRWQCPVLLVCQRCWDVGSVSDMKLVPVSCFLDSQSAERCTDSLAFYKIKCLAAFDSNVLWLLVKISHIQQSLSSLCLDC